MLKLVLFLYRNFNENLNIATTSTVTIHKFTVTPYNKTITSYLRDINYKYIGYKVDTNKKIIIRSKPVDD